MTESDRVVLVENDIAGTLRNTAVSHIGLQVPDVEQNERFYADILGLTKQNDLPGGGVRMGWGTGHHVVDLLPGEKKLAHFGFEVRDAGGIAGIRGRLQAAGYQVEELDPTYVDFAQGEIEAISAINPDGTPVHFHSAVWRQGENAERHGGSVPLAYWQLA